MKASLILLLTSFAVIAGEVVNLRNGSLGVLAAKAEQGESLRIVTIGGSITQSGKGHSSMIPEWFKKRFPKNSIEGVNAGLSSTCSHSGAFRLESHVLKRKPIDLLVAEFAVNDDQDAGHSYEAAVRGMEGVVRRAYSEGIPVIMMMYVNPALLKSVEDDKPAIPLRAHHAVADRYGVPTIDVNVALAQAIEKDEFSWKDYGGVHPNVKGYAFATAFVTDAIEELLMRPATELVLPEPVDAASFGSGHWVGPDAADYKGTWVHGNPSRETLPVGAIRKDYLSYPLSRANEAGATLTLRFSGSAVGAFVLAGPDAGIVEARIDGGPTREIDLFHRYSGGLNYPRTVMFAEGLATGEHVLRLKLTDKKNRRSKGHSCSILYFAVNR